MPISVRKVVLLSVNLVSTVFTLLTGLRENPLIVQVSGRYDHVRARLREGTINYDIIREDVVSKGRLPDLTDIGNSYRFLSTPRRSPDNLAEDRSTCMRHLGPNCRVANFKPKWYNETCVKTLGAGDEPKCHRYILDNFQTLSANRVIQVGVASDFGTPGVPFLKCLGRPEKQFDYYTDLMVPQNYWAGGSYHLELQTSRCRAQPLVRNDDWEWGLFKVTQVDKAADVLIAVDDNGWISVIISVAYGVVTVVMITRGVLAAILRDQPDGAHLTVNEGPAERDLGIVGTKLEAERLARRHAVNPVLQLEPHPALDPVLPLWGSVKRLHGKRLRSFVSHDLRQRALRSAAATRDRAHAQHPAMASALDKVSWGSIHAIPHSSSRQRVLLHRIKGLRLSGYDRGQGTSGCPHCPEMGTVGGQTQHIMWSCSHAQQLWQQLLSFWRGHGLWPSSTHLSEASFLDAVFSLRLPSVPRRAWALPALALLDPQDHQAAVEVFPTLQAAWQQQVLVTFLCLKQWRDGFYDPTTAWTTAQAKSVHAAAIRSTLHRLSFAFQASERHGHPGAKLLLELAHTSPEPSVTVSADEPLSPARYLLFFDGGSRGNPGPGGSGAVIVATDTLAAAHPNPVPPEHGSGVTIVATDASGSAASLTWSASMSYSAATTTNNTAEYHGLLAGLRAAVTHRWSPLEVIGDSLLILRQLRYYRPPRNARLLPLYAEARRLADQLGVVRWHHHLRAFNKMADHLANVAMNSRSSIQTPHPMVRHEHDRVQGYLQNDFQHWQVTSGSACLPGLNVIRPIFGPP